MFKVLPDLFIRTRCPSREVSGLSIPPEVFMFHHYGLARTPERVRLKYSTTDARGYKNVTYDIDKWLKEKFVAWKDNKEIEDIHPFNPKGGVLWKKTSKVKEFMLPEIMKTHKWYNVECIE